MLQCANAEMPIHRSVWLETLKKAIYYGEAMMKRKVHAARGCTGKTYCGKLIGAKLVLGDEPTCPACKIAIAPNDKRGGGAMSDKVTIELLDKLDTEHDKLVQPRECDRDMRRLARIGLQHDYLMSELAKEGETWRHKAKNAYAEIAEKDVAIAVLVASIELSIQMKDTQYIVDALTKHKEKT